MNDDQFKYLITFIGAFSMMIIAYILIISAIIMDEGLFPLILSGAGLGVLSFTFAVISNGYNRRAWSRVVTFEEPPLEDRRPYEGDAL